MFYLKNECLTLFNDTAQIKRRSHDGVAFAEFDRNFNFIPNNILLDFVTRSKIMKTIVLVG